MSVSVFNNEKVGYVNVRQCVDSLERSTLLARLLNNSLEVKPSTNGFVQAGFERAYQEFSKRPEVLNQPEFWWKIDAIMNILGVIYFPKTYRSYVERNASRKLSPTNKGSGTFVATLNNVAKSYEKCNKKSWRKPNGTSRYTYFVPAVIYAGIFTDNMSMDVALPQVDSILSVIKRNYDASCVPSSSRTCTSDGVRRNIREVLSRSFPEVSDPKLIGNPQLWMRLSDFLRTDVGRADFPVLHGMAVSVSQDTKNMYYNLGSDISSVSEQPPFCYKLLSRPVTEGVKGSPRLYYVPVLYHVLAACEQYFCRKLTQEEETDAEE